MKTQAKKFRLKNNPGKIMTANQVRENQYKKWIEGSPDEYLIEKEWLRIHG